MGPRLHPLVPCFSLLLLSASPPANSNLVSRPPESVCLITQVGIPGWGCPSMASLKLEFQGEGVLEWRDWKRRHHPNWPLGAAERCASTSKSPGGHHFFFGPTRYVRLFPPPAALCGRRGRSQALRLPRAVCGHSRALCGETVEVAAARLRETSCGRCKSLNSVRSVVPFFHWPAWASRGRVRLIATVRAFPTNHPGKADEIPVV